MRQVPLPNGAEDRAAGSLPTARSWVDRPTLRGMLMAAVSLVPLGAVSVLVLIPAVFFLVPLSPGVDALTLCLPGLGPVHRVRDDLGADQEEVVWVHERVHAEQCRRSGAARFAREATTPRGRLRLEVQALCAEVEVLSMRGLDRHRLIDRTVEALGSEYFGDGRVTRPDIAVAVDAECGGARGVVGTPRGAAKSRTSARP